MEILKCEGVRKLYGTGNNQVTALDRIDLSVAVSYTHLHSSTTRPISCLGSYRLMISQCFSISSSILRARTNPL